jgi:hypothetical protein
MVAIDGYEKWILKWKEYKGLIIFARFVGMKPIEEKPVFNSYDLLLYKIRR